jgi:hypothetical protein
MTTETELKERVSLLKGIKSFFHNWTIAVNASKSVKSNTDFYPLSAGVVDDRSPSIKGSIFDIEYTSITPTDVILQDIKDITKKGM